MVAFVVYFIFSFIVFRKLEDRSLPIKLLLILIGVIIVHIPQRLIDFNSQLVSLPEFACELAGILFGWIFFISGKWLRAVTLLTSFLFCTLMFRYYEAINNALYFNDITLGRSATNTHADAVPYLDSDQHVINQTLFDSDKYILMNYWSTSCGSCMAEFPLLDSMYVSAASGDKATVYSACILMREADKTAKELVRRKGFHFPVLTIENWDLVQQQFGFNGVPMTFVVKNRQTLFRGTLPDAWHFIEEHG